jgi:predicted dehydrogenase
MSDQVSRRDILRGSAAAVAGLAVASASAQDQKTSKPERLRVGIIGCGGKGWSGMQLAAAHSDIVALCDVDVRERIKANAEHPRASSFDDYREMFKAMRGKMDAVVISIPDHHHATATALAIKQGIHCYTEKPLTRTIWEARQLAILAKKHKIASQMGNQSTASTPMRKVAKMLRDKTFGEIKEVHIWTNRAAAYWKQGIPRPATSSPPKELDYNTWLGPRPERPYGEGYHPFSWRGWWDFGTGALGDMGCHLLNTIHMAVDVSSPIAVQAQTSGHNKDSFPDWSIVTYEFPAKNGHAAFKLFWYDGGKKPPQSIAPDSQYGPNGALFVCEKDVIFNHHEGNTNFDLVSGELLPEVEVEVSPGHMEEFIRAAMGGKPAVSNFPNYSGPLTEAVLLGNLAIWANGPRLEWDAKNMKVKGSTEYDELIKPKYRDGWSV